MANVVLSYPHYLPSREPRPMRAPEIWSVAEAARRQLCVHPKRPRVEVGSIITRCRRLEVNQLAFDTHWECGLAVSDGDGTPVLGVTEHDGDPSAAMIYLNGELMQDRDDLVRSTALHELGHAVFDVPGWIAADVGLQRSYRTDVERTRQPIDWREWRANEFMGAFLAPRRLLHSHLVRRAASLGLPLVTGGRDDELPVLRAAPSNGYVETLLIELAELFGVSPDFIEVRLRKYGLVAEA